MNDREVQDKAFAYEDDGALDMCPACGETLKLGKYLYACDRCWQFVVDAKENIPLRKMCVREGRAAVHELGKRWRGNGLLPPLASAPAPKPCADCGASPCDCLHLIWGYWFLGAAAPEWFSSGERASAVADRRRAEAWSLSPLGADWKRTRGPVQRRSEPNPFAAASTRVAVDLAALPPLPPVPVPAASPSTGRLDVVLRPSRDALARVLFDLDAAVLAAVARVDDQGSLPRSALLTRAWARDESGRRTWALATAKAIALQLGWPTDDDKGARP